MIGTGLAGPPIIAAVISLVAGTAVYAGISLPALRLVMGQTDSRRQTADDRQGHVSLRPFVSCRS